MLWYMLIFIGVITSASESRKRRVKRRWIHLHTGKINYLLLIIVLKIYLQWVYPLNIYNIFTNFVDISINLFDMCNVEPVWTLNYFIHYRIVPSYFQIYKVSYFKFSPPPFDISKFRSAFYIVAAYYLYHVLSILSCPFFYNAVSGVFGKQAKLRYAIFIWCTHT